MSEKKTNNEDQIASNFNQISKNVGEMGFSIKYTAIPSNRKIHDDFKVFAFEEANNNYLSAINLLLKYRKIFDWFELFEQRLTEAEMKMDGLRDFVIKEKESSETKEDKAEKKPKTF